MRIWQQPFVMFQFYYMERVKCSYVSLFAMTCRLRASPQATMLSMWCCTWEGGEVVFHTNLRVSACGWRWWRFSYSCLTRQRCWHSCHGSAQWCPVQIWCWHGMIGIWYGTWRSHTFHVMVRLVFWIVPYPAGLTSGDDWCVVNDQPVGKLNRKVSWV
jgi:hypothetical protein